MTRALAIVDGEHYAPVVRDALAELPYEVVGAWLAGGTEKLRDGFELGVPLVESLEAGLELGPELVVDLSDEPVLGPRERFLVASRVLAAGLPYVGADFRFDPPELQPFPLLSLGIVGTGKRIGKTAVSGHVARLLSRTREVVVVAMGRGGPAEPEIAEPWPTLARLLELSRAGRHAASDYLEDAALAGVPTIGCWRCGGGLAGAPFASNVAAGAELALERSPDLVIFEGSGSALPPIETTRRLLVTAADRPLQALDPYRVLTSDLVVVTLAEREPAELRAAIRELRDVPVIAVRLRPRPVEPIAGRRVAYFTTAPASAHESLAAHLRDAHGAEVVHVSGNLARREALRAELAAVDADVLLTEIKAAAIDVVAEDGRELVFADNELVPLEGEPSLDAAVEELVAEAVPA